MIMSSPTVEELLPELGADMVAGTRRVSAYSSSFRLEEIRVELADGSERTAMCKDLSWGSLLEGARAIRTPGAHDPRREIGVYQRLLGLLPAGPPQLFSARADEAAGRYWLCLEQIDGLQLRHVGEGEAWQATATWTGRFHAAGMAPAARATAVALGLPMRDEASLRAPLAALRDHPEAVRRPALVAALAGCHGEVVDRLLAAPQSVIHGQLYPANIVIESRPDGPRVAVVDWETAAVGPSVLDLAALVEGSWLPSQRDALVRAYLTGRDGASDADAERQISIELTCARIQLALELATLTSTAWIPSDMADDWLARAVALCDELSRPHHRPTATIAARNAS